MFIDDFTLIEVLADYFYDAFFKDFKFVPLFQFKEQSDENVVDFYTCILISDF